MATLATQQISLTGLAATFAAVGASDKFTPDERTVLHFKNSNAATRTVTIDSKVLSDLGTDVNVAVVIPADTGDIVIGPFPAQRFMGSDGLADISYSATA